jgi:hypothetical protein
VTRLAVLLLAGALVAGCGATTSAQPKDDPGVFATKVVDLIVHFKVTHTVHVVADHGKCTWILPAWRYRDYKGDTCPTDAGSAPPPVQS